MELQYNAENGQKVIDSSVDVCMKEIVSSSSRWFLIGMFTVITMVGMVQVVIKMVSGDRIGVYFIFLCISWLIMVALWVSHRRSIPASRKAISLSVNTACAFYFIYGNRFVAKTEKGEAGGGQ